MTATTYSYCWLITRKDGQKFGFTDHDRDIVFDSNLFLPVDGALSTTIIKTSGVEMDNLEVEGGISDDMLTDEDLDSGLFDNASVQIWIVDWSNVSDRNLLVDGTLGRVQTTDTGFSVELNSIRRQLTKPNGSVYQRTCTLEVGESKCGVDLTDSAYSISDTVDSITDHTVIMSDLSGFDDGWFTLGHVVVSGGKRYQIRSHIGNQIDLWEVPSPAINTGDTLTIRAGCKRDIETCRVKFDNQNNFRGYGGLMPGNDRLTEYVIQGSEVYDGGSLFR